MRVLRPDRPRRLILALLAVAVACLLGTGSAAARPAIPGFPDCKDAPTAALPDSGVAGWLDPAPEPTPPPGNPFADSPTTSIYDQYGYAGLRWATFDLGCGGSIRDPQASADTMLGNLGLSGAVFVTALGNGIHNKVSDPSSYLGPLDRVVDRVSQRMYDAIWTPWGAVAVLGLAGLLLLYSTRGQLSSVLSGAMWALLVMALLSGLVAFPGRAASFFDDAVTQTIGALQARSAGLATEAPGDPARSQGALAVDAVLYQGWVRGALGSSESEAARRWGPRLFQAGAFKRSDAEAVGGARAKELAEKKAEEWKAVAEEVQSQDPSTYAVLQGKAGGRAGAGFLTFAGSMFTVGFRVLADGLLVAGLVMLRLLVMFFPAAAVVGIFAPLSYVVRRMGSIAAASLVNVVAFTAGSVIHTTAVGAILSTATGTGLSVMALLLCLVLTVAALVLMRPFISLTRMLGGRPCGSLLQTVKRNAIRYAVSRKATQDATSDVLEEQSRKAPSDSSDRRGEPEPPRSETFRRAAPVWDVTSDGVAWGKGGVATAQALPRSAPPAGGSATSSGPASGRPQDRGPRHEDGPGGSATPPVLVGRVVGPDRATSDRPLTVVRPHDGNAELRSDGTFTHEEFDPTSAPGSDEREAS